jgi:hypothetical protein
LNRRRRKFYGGKGNSRQTEKEASIVHGNLDLPRDLSDETSWESSNEILSAFVQEQHSDSQSHWNEVVFDWNSTSQEDLLKSRDAERREKRQVWEARGQKTESSIKAQSRNGQTLTSSRRQR